MTPEELEALADRVEALAERCDETNAMVTCAIRWFPPETGNALRSTDCTLKITSAGWVGIYRPGQEYVATSFWAPDFTGSLDAAVTAISDGTEWEMTTLYGVVRVTVGLNNSDGAIFHGSNECGLIAPAIVAAGLRERAHVLRSGGAA